MIGQNVRGMRECFKGDGEMDLGYLGYTNWLAILRCSSYLSQLFHYMACLWNPGFFDDHPLRMIIDSALKSACTLW